MTRSTRNLPASTAPTAITLRAYHTSPFRSINQPLGGAVSRAKTLQVLEERSTHSVMAPPAGRSRFLDSTHTALIGIAAVGVVAIIASLTSSFSGTVFRAAAIASSVALLFGAVAARVVAGPIERQLRDTVNNLLAVEDELARTNHELEQ